MPSDVNVGDAFTKLQMMRSKIKVIERDVRIVKQLAAQADEIFQESYSLEEAQGNEHHRDAQVTDQE